MPIVRQETLNQLESKKDEAIRNAAELRRELDDALATVASLERTIRVDRDVKEKIAEYEQDIHIGDFESQVVAELVAKGREKVTEDIKDGLREQKRSEVFAEVQVTHGPQIRDELDELFKTDGTYEDIEKEATAESRRGVAADLRAEAKKKAETALNDPEAKAAYLASIADEIAQDPEVLRHAQTYESQLHREWRDEAIQLALTAAEHDVLAGKDEFMVEATETYVNSRKGSDALASVRRSAKKTIEGLAIDELLKDTENEAYQAVLKERQALEADKMAAKNHAEKLALDFVNGGVETEGIEQGTVVELLLGKIGEGTIKKRTSNYGYDENVTVPMLYLNRTITVTAMGKGSFRVDKDSLADSSNPYAEQQSLAEGSVITVGMLVREMENGQSKDKLLPVLKAGSTLQYDTDTTTPEFTNTHLTLADIKVNDVSARKYEAVKKEYL